MNIRTRVLLAWLLVVLSLVAFAACGDDDDEGEDETGTATTATGSATSAATCRRRAARPGSRR
jgi:hypothetical protein